MANRNTVAMAERNMELEERVNTLEATVGELADARRCLEERITVLETLCNETLPGLIATKANQARDEAIAEAERLAHEARTCAVADAVAEAVAEAERLAHEARDEAIAEAERLAHEARDEAIAEAERLAHEAREGAEATAKGLVDALAEAVDKRLDALEEQTNRELPELIDRKAKEAHDTAVADAEAKAKELVDALSFDLNKKLGDLATIVGKLDTDVKRLDKEVKDLQDPQGAVKRIAGERLPLYRSYSVDELKDAVEHEKSEVLKWIARLLNPGDNTDSRVLTNMFIFAKGDELMAELVTLSGAGDNANGSASGGSFNGR